MKLIFLRLMSIKHIYSILPRMINMSELNLPTTLASLISTDLSYMRQQRVHKHQIQYPLMINNGSMIENSIQTTYLGKHRNYIRPL
ncbi:hypothetical protein LINGRAHAP2_LOCUS6705 [Linum grandiflorum]